FIVHCYHPCDVDQASYFLNRIQKFKDTASRKADAKTDDFKPSASLIGADVKTIRPFPNIRISIPCCYPAQVNQKVPVLAYCLIKTGRVLQVRTIS
ncbi:MAG: hypothetical protein OEM03_03990, partial [Chromatiales bacterium]|nr:hypothetical protein [Chromatiales bacterium]